MNPHTDIHAPGHIHVSLQQVTYMSQDKLLHNEVACVHTPDGGTPYTLPPDRLHVLYTRFSRTQSQSPGLHEKLKAGSFAAELYKLLARYKEGSRGKNKTVTKGQARDLWAIQAHTQSTKERFASPLNFSASTGAYWTLLERRPAATYTCYQGCPV